MIRFLVVLAMLLLLLALVDVGAMIGSGLLERSIKFFPREAAMPEIELSAGTIEYEDTGGSGPVIVLFHGLAMDGRQWRHVVPGLREDYRCVLPTLPLGAHRKPMRPDADLSLLGQVRIIAELLERLDLTEATLCFIDWGGAQPMIADGLTDRVARFMLCSCEAFENYPPGVPGKMAALSAKIPGGLRIMRRTLLTRPLRQLPFTFGTMSKRGVPDELMRDWLAPLAQPEIRRDLAKYAGHAKQARATSLAATEKLPFFDRPVLVVWAGEDRLMPHAHGRRLADIFPQGRLVEIADSYTLITEDQPAELTRHIREFLAQTTAVA
jgi:pimeloyl-ACP methyl ester carboxylesterase